MEYLTDANFRNLSQKVKPFAWVIKVNLNDESIQATETYCTGFAIDKHGFGDSIKHDDTVLLTCAHCLNHDRAKHSIKVRKLDDNAFFMEAQILAMKPTWDIALLVVKGAGHNAYAEFAQDASISNCQTLIHVGHSDNFVWSVFIGRCVYQCVNNVVLPTTGKTCGAYHCSSLNITPKYRIMGHVWNTQYFDKYASKRFLFEKNLNPLIPIIQCAGFSCRDGCSGGPVFNIEGYIVGMIVGDFDGSQVAIHVTLLKEFVRINSTTSTITKDSPEDAQRQLKRKGPCN